MDDEKLKDKVLDLFTDASVRMNSTRAGIGGWICVHDRPEEVVYCYSTEVPYEGGINGLEYLSIIHGVEAALSLGVRFLYIRTDSELVVKQLAGEYGVYEGRIKDRYTRLSGLLSNISGGYEIKHIFREFNAIADVLAGTASGRADALKKYKYLGEAYERTNINPPPPGIGSSGVSSRKS